MLVGPRFRTKKPLKGLDEVKAASSSNLEAGANMVMWYFRSALWFRVRDSGLWMLLVEGSSPSNLFQR